MSKARHGPAFEDLEVGRTFRHAPPRTLGAGEVALHRGLTGGRHALTSSGAFARSLGLSAAPIDDLLVFHVVYGLSVPDISQDAIATLGIAECRFERHVFPGDSIEARSTVIGRKANSDGQTGTVWVRSQGIDQDGRSLVEFVRAMLVRRRDPAAAIPAAEVPELRDHFGVDELHVPTDLRARSLDREVAGIRHLFEDYAIGERIDHIAGATVEEAEHRIAARLYQNSGRAHLDAFAARSGRFGRSIVYGGHVLSLARALGYNGLEGALRVAAINRVTHVRPCFAGDTVHAWTEVLETAAMPDRRDFGALRLRMIATRDRPCHDFPDKGADGRFAPEVLLEFDHWVLVPRRPRA